MKGQMVNESTGEIFDIEHYLYPMDLRMWSIIKVTEVASFHHPDNSFQVSISCEALDSVGAVFEMSINYFPDNAVEKDRIVEDIKTGEIYRVEGRYGIFGNGVSIFEPNIKPMTGVPLACEQEIRHVFQINSMKGD